MKKIYIILLTFLMLSCSGDPTNWIGGTQLIATVHNINGKTIVNKYHYDSDKRMIEIEGEDERIEIQYKEGKAHQFLNFGEEDRFISRDSIAYSENGQMDKLYVFSINDEGAMPLNETYEFIYDAAGQLTEKRSLHHSNSIFTNTKYTWKAGNVIKESHFNEDGELTVEFFYTYDDQVGYEKNIPTSIKYPVWQSQNNVTKMSWESSSVVIDGVCNPCEYTYRYNADGYPVYMEANWGLIKQFTYKNEE